MTTDLKTTGCSRPHDVILPLVICAAVLMTAIHLASTRGLWSSLETQSAQIAREFLAGTDLIVPHLNGAEDNEKPAFYFWLVALFSFLTGGVTELSARLPSLAAALGITAVFFALAKKSALLTAAAASAVLLTSPRVFWLSQVARMDMVFAFLCFCSAACFIFYWEAEQPETKKRFIYLFYLSAGLATLCKGPAGIVLPGLPALAMFVVHKRYRDLLLFFFSPALLLFFAVVLPWYLLVSLKTEGRFLSKFVLGDNIGRFFGPSSLSFSQEFTKRQPLWFYIPHFFTSFFPWSIALVLMAPSLIRRTKELLMREKFLMLYAGLIFIVFSLAGVKRSDYLLPVYPACAFLLASRLGDTFSARPLRLTCLAAVLPAAAGLFLLAAARGGALVPGKGLLSRFFPPEDLDRVNTLLQHVPAGLLSALLALAAAGLAAAFFRNRACFSALLASMAAAILFAGFEAAPIINRQRDIRPFCGHVKKIAGRECLWFFGFWNDEFVFYLGRFIEPATADKGMSRDELVSLLKSGKPRKFFLARKEDYEKLQAEKVAVPFALSEDAPELYPVVLIANFRPEAQP
jgi:4-amino-4-deoxy-L-arabinose transferase-like glycosyltransferase